MFVGVFVGVPVGVLVGVFEGVFVGVTVGVLVGVFVGVFVGVLVAVGVGDGVVIRMSAQPVAAPSMSACKLSVQTDAKPVASDLDVNCTRRRTPSPFIYIGGSWTALPVILTVCPSGCRLPPKMLNCSERVPVLETDTYSIFEESKVKSKV